MTDQILPVVQGDWVARPGQGGFEVARVRQSYWDGGRVYCDLVPYALSGKNIGRQSPALGGPKSFEPHCLFTDNGWKRIESPSFPLEAKLVGTTIGDDRMRLEMSIEHDGHGGVRAKAIRTSVRKQSGDRRTFVLPNDDRRLRAALRKIKDGHNDPRALAAEVLGEKL